MRGREGGGNFHKFGHPPFKRMAQLRPFCDARIGIIAKAPSLGPSTPLSLPLALCSAFPFLYPQCYSTIPHMLIICAHCVTLPCSMYTCTFCDTLPPDRPCLCCFALPLVQFVLSVLLYVTRHCFLRTSVLLCPLIIVAVLLCVTLFCPLCISCVSLT